MSEFNFIALSKDNSLEKKTRKKKKSKNKKAKLNNPESEEFDSDEIIRLEKEVLSSTNNAGLVDSLNEESFVIDHKLDESQRKRKWTDEGDYQVPVPERQKKFETTDTKDDLENLLRHKYMKSIGANQTWATKIEHQTSSNADNVEDDNAMKSCGKIVKRNRSLQSGIIKLKRMEDLNVNVKVLGKSIKTVEFHPSSTVAMIAQQSGTVSLVQVDGKTNSKLYSMKFENFPIECAHFTTDGNQFVIGNKKSNKFWYYDINGDKYVETPIHHNIDSFNMSKFMMTPDGKYITVCGKSGFIHLLDAKSKEWLCKLKMNTKCVDMTFNDTGTRMYSFGETGEIYEWDMNSRKCIQKMNDDGCVRGLSIEMSPNNEILATGSESGIVNVYNKSFDALNSVSKPVKCIKNLVTPINCMAFNSTSEILAIASTDKDQAVRLVHFPSMTTYKNFPTFSDVGKPSVLAFSPMSGYFAMGNTQGFVYLYRIKYYKNY